MRYPKEPASRVAPLSRWPYMRGERSAPETDAVVRAACPPDRLESRCPDAVGIATSTRSAAPLHARDLGCGLVPAEPTLCLIWLSRSDGEEAVQNLYVDTREAEQ